MKSLPSEVGAMVTARRFNLARCVRITTRQGDRVGLIDHDVDKDIYIDEASGDMTSYLSNPGLMMTEIDMVVGLDADATEITIPLGDVVSRADVMGRKFNSAEVLIFDIDWTLENPTSASMVDEMKGYITEGKIVGNKAVFEVRSQSDLWNMTIGRIASPRCSADFGDTQCGVSKTWIDAVVTSVTDSETFTVDLAGSYADNYFRFGEAEFYHGVLAGLPAMEVYDYVGSTGEVTLLVPLPRIPSVGDVLQLARGCSRLKKSTDTSIPTCATNSNVNRFRGFDKIPGSDVYLKVAVPGANGA